MRVHVALFFVSLLYAILFSWAGQIMPTFLTPEAFVLLRVITATILFYLFSMTVPKDPIRWKEHGLEFALCGFFGTSANMYLFFHGLALTHPINGAILMLVTPLFVGIFDHLRLRVLPSRWFVFGTLVAAAASVWLMVGKGAIFNHSTLKGDLFVAINALLYAVYLVRVKKIAHIYKPITINKITFSFGTLYMLPIGGWSLYHTNFTAFSPSITAKVLYILFFTSFLVYLLNSYAVKKAGPTLAGLYIYLQPVLATIIAVFLGTDHLTPTKTLLMAFIMGGVYLATRFSPK
jgi:drug/metabolite transporter (DMT)-like permease